MVIGEVNEDLDTEINFLNKLPVTNKAKNYCFAGRRAENWYVASAHITSNLDKTLKIFLQKKRPQSQLVIQPLEMQPKTSKIKLEVILYFEKTAPRPSRIRASCRGQIRKRSLRGLRCFEIRKSSRTKSGQANVCVRLGISRVSGQATHSRAWNSLLRRQYRRSSNRHSSRVKRTLLRADLLKV